MIAHCSTGATCSGLVDSAIGTHSLRCKPEINRLLSHVRQSVIRATYHITAQNVTRLCCLVQASYDSRLQQYLQQQAQHVQPQLHNGFSNLQLGGTLGEIPGAVSSSCSSTADPVIACGQLQTAVPPALVQHAATGAGAASHAVTGFGRVLKTQAVADALPGCNSASTATATVPAEEWTTTQAISNAPAGTAYAPCAKAAPLSESADARGPAAAPSAVVAVATATAVVNLETDDELLAQKKAARARLAELEGTTAPAGSSAAAEVASKASAIAPVAAEGLSDTAKQTCAGASSVHNCAVPQRPRPLVGKLQMASCSADTAFGEGQTAMLVAGPVMQPCRFTQALTAGLLMCLMLLATSWWLQVRSGPVVCPSYCRRGVYAYDRHQWQNLKRVSSSGLAVSFQPQPCGT